MKEVHIRPEKPQDEDAIHQVTAEAFRTAAHTSGAEQAIVRELRAAGALSISLVAEGDSGIVGHIALSPVTLSDGSPGWYGLGPVSVLPRAQGLGIGSRLVQEVLRSARERGFAGCVLLGEPSFYGRFGFRAESSLVLPGVPPEYFQALVFHGPVPAATVRYHAAFDTAAA